jgi:phosphoribosyl-ATP pyrophosphohydrolase
MADTLFRLAATIADRRTAAPGTSYVASLLAKGMPKIAQKLGEEAVETVIAAMAGDQKGVTGEAADLLFHLMVLLDAAKVPLDDVLAELDRREGVSGLDEKAARTAAPPAEPAPAPIRPAIAPETAGSRPLSAVAADPAPVPGLALGRKGAADERPRIRKG